MASSVSSKRRITGELNGRLHQRRDDERGDERGDAQTQLHDIYAKRLSAPNTTQEFWPNLALRTRRAPRIIMSCTGIGS